MRSLPAACVLSVAVLLGAATPAAWSASSRPAPTRAAAEQALTDAQQAGERGRDYSLALRDLYVALPALSASDQRTARAILARPTDNPSDPSDAETGADYSVREAAPLCSPRFCVHYVTTTEDAPDLTDSDGDRIPNYVESTLEIFEEVYKRENGPRPAGLGWPLPPSDNGAGGGNQVDVYLADIGAAGLYGYVAPEAGSGKIFSSYQVMDDDYAEPGFAGLDSLRVTAAHEYNHVLQFGINATMDSWVFEATATWMEEAVYPAIDDYLQYLDPIAAGVGTPLTSFIDEGPLANFQYGSAVWNHYLRSRFGEDVVREVWTQSEEGEDALSSYDRAIPLRADTSFAEAFGGFATAVAEWRSSPARFPDNALYPNAARSGSLARDGLLRTETLDHASYKFLDVPSAGREPIRLEATFPANLPGTIALVGRPSGGGPVVERIVDVPAGGPATVVLEDAGSFERVTAVLVNGDRDHGEFDVNANEWRWTGDGARVSARVARVQAADVTPPETTIDSGPEGTVTPTTATFTFSANEPATFACRLDGGAYLPCGNPVSYGGLAAGEHSFEVRATDAAGNVDASPASRRFTVGRQEAPPTVVPPGPKPPSPLPPITRDRTAPLLGVTVLARVRAGKLPLRITCPFGEPGTCKGTLALTARIKGRTLKVGTVKFTGLRGDQSRKVNVRVSRDASVRIRRVGKVTGTIRVRVSDTAGNVGTRTLRRQIRG